MAASNPALVQLWLLPLALIPGVLAYKGLLSNNRAGLCIIVLYFVSPWHTSRIQRRLEARPRTAPSQPQPQSQLPRPSSKRKD